jgi:hypothetical protein
MKVRCIRIINPVTGSPEERSDSIRIGEEYVVIEVVASPRRDIKLRLYPTEGAPGLWASEMFETTDESIPSNWTAAVSGAGFLSVRPARWRSGFWEQYFDDEPEAVAIFEEELATMLAQS